MAGADVMEDIRTEAALAVADALVNNVNETRTHNALKSHSWKFPPSVVRAVVLVQACLRRRDFLRSFGGAGAGLDEEVAEFAPPPPLLAVSLYFCRRMRNPHFVDVENEASAVAGIVSAKEVGVSVRDVLEVLSFYTDTVPSNHFSITLLQEKLNNMVVAMQESLRDDVDRLHAPNQVQRAIDDAVVKFNVPEDLEHVCLRAAKVRLQDVIAATELELRTELAASSSVIEMDAIQVKLEKLFGPVETDVRNDINVVRERRTQFLETELETRWSRPFAGPLPPHSLAARRYEIELGIENPKVAAFVKEEQRYVSSLEAQFEVALTDLQKRIKELTQKRKDARARSVIQDIEAKLTDTAKEVQSVIEDAILKIGADNLKVQNRAKEMLSPEAHSTVYSIQSERAADDLRAELSQDDPSPEAGDRRRSCAQTLEALLECLSPQHPLQDELRAEFAKQLAEVAKVRTATQAAQTPLISEMDVEALDLPPTPPPELVTRKPSERGQPQGDDEESDDDDGWGAPPGFAHVENMEQPKATKQLGLPNGGIPEFAFDNEEKKPDDTTKPNEDALSTLKAFEKGEDAPAVEPTKALTAQLTLQDLTMDVVKVQTESVFSNKIIRAITEALSISRQRITVVGLQEGSVKVMLSVSEPEPGEPPGFDGQGVTRSRPLGAADVIAELTKQLDDPASKLRLGEIGPFLTSAVIEHGIGGPERKMEHGTLATAYAAEKYRGEGLDQPQHAQSLAWMSTAEPPAGSLGTAALDTAELGITWGASRFEPDSVHNASHFRTTCPQAEEDETAEKWAVPFERQQPYSFYDKKAEDASKEPPTKLPPSKQKFTTHASFHLTRHPAGGMSKLKGLQPPGQPHIAAAASWLDSAEARLQGGDSSPTSTAKDLDLKDDASSKSDSPSAKRRPKKPTELTKKATLENLGEVAESTPQSPEQTTRSRDTSPKAKAKGKSERPGELRGSKSGELGKSGGSAKSELPGQPEESQSEAEERQDRRSSSSSPKPKSGRRSQPKAGLSAGIAEEAPESPAGSTVGSARRPARSPKASSESRPSVEGASSPSRSKPKSRPSVAKQREARLVDEDESDEAPAERLSPSANRRSPGPDRSAQHSARSASAKELRARPRSEGAGPPTPQAHHHHHQQHSQKPQFDHPGMAESALDSTASFAGMYGGIPGTGVRRHIDNNERLPTLVGRPSADQLKTPAYVRMAYRHGTVGCGPPYRTLEEGQEDSPAWTAMQMLDASLEKADWKRSYNSATKSRCPKLGPQDGIRGMGKSVSLPRFPPANRRPRVRSAQRPTRPEAKQPARGRRRPSESEEDSSPRLPEQTQMPQQQGSVIADAIDVGEVEGTQEPKDEAPERESPKEAKDAKEQSPKLQRLSLPQEQEKSAEKGNSPSGSKESPSPSERSPTKRRTRVTLKVKKEDMQELTESIAASSSSPPAKEEKKEKDEKKKKDKDKDKKGEKATKAKEEPEKKGKEGKEEPEKKGKEGKQKDDTKPKSKGGKKASSSAPSDSPGAKSTDKRGSKVAKDGQEKTEGKAEGKKKGGKKDRKASVSTERRTSDETRVEKAPVAREAGAYASKPSVMTWYTRKMQSPDQSARTVSRVAAAALLQSIFIRAAARDTSSDEAAEAQAAVAVAGAAQAAALSLMSTYGSEAELIIGDSQPPSTIHSLMGTGRAAQRPPGNLLGSTQELDDEALTEALVTPVASKASEVRPAFSERELPMPDEPHRANSVASQAPPTPAAAQSQPGSLASTLQPTVFVTEPPVQSQPHSRAPSRAPPEHLSVPGTPAAAAAEEQRPGEALPAGSRPHSREANESAPGSMPGLLPSPAHSCDLRSYLSAVAEGEPGKEALSPVAWSAPHSRPPSHTSEAQPLADGAAPGRSRPHSATGLKPVEDTSYLLASAPHSLVPSQASDVKPGKHKERYPSLSHAHSRTSSLGGSSPRALESMSMAMPGLLRDQVPSMMSDATEVLSMSGPHSRAPTEISEATEVLNASGPHSYAPSEVSEAMLDFALERVEALMPLSPLSKTGSEVSESRPGSEETAMRPSLPHSRHHSKVPEPTSDILAQHLEAQEASVEQPAAVPPQVVVQPPAAEPEPTAQVSPPEVERRAEQPAVVPPQVVVQPPAAEPEPIAQVSPPEVERRVEQPAVVPPQVVVQPPASEPEPIAQISPPEVERRAHQDPQPSPAVEPSPGPSAAEVRSDTQDRTPQPEQVKTDDPVGPAGPAPSAEVQAQPAPAKADEPAGPAVPAPSAEVQPEAEEAKAEEPAAVAAGPQIGAEVQEPGMVRTDSMDFDAPQESPGQGSRSRLGSQFRDRAPSHDDATPPGEVANLEVPPTADSSHSRESSFPPPGHAPDEDERSSPPRSRAKSRPTSPLVTQPPSHLQQQPQLAAHAGSRESSLAPAEYAACQQETPPHHRPLSRQPSGDAVSPPSEHLQHSPGQVAPVGSRESSLAPVDRAASQHDSPAIHKPISRAPSGDALPGRDPEVQLQQSAEDDLPSHGSTPRGAPVAGEAGEREDVPKPRRPSVSGLPLARAEEPSVHDGQPAVADGASSRASSLAPMESSPSHQPHQPPSAQTATAPEQTGGYAPDLQPAVAPDRRPSVAPGAQEVQEPPAVRLQEPPVSDPAEAPQADVQPPAARPTAGYPPNAAGRPPVVPPLAPHGLAPAPAEPPVAPSTDSVAVAPRPAASSSAAPPRDVVSPPEQQPADPSRQGLMTNSGATRQQVASFAQSMTSSIFRSSMSGAAQRRASGRPMPAPAMPPPAMPGRPLASGTVLAAGSLAPQPQAQQQPPPRGGPRGNSFSPPRPITGRVHAIPAEPSD